MRVAAIRQAQQLKKKDDAPQSNRRFSEKMKRAVLAKVTDTFIRGIEGNQGSDFVKKDKQSVKNTLMQLKQLVDQKEKTAQDLQHQNTLSQDELHFLEKFLASENDQNDWFSHEHAQSIHEKYTISQQAKAMGDSATRQFQFNDVFGGKGWFDPALDKKPVQQDSNKMVNGWLLYKKPPETNTGSQEKQEMANGVNKLMFAFKGGIAESNKSINARLKDGQFLVDGLILDHECYKSLNLFDNKSRLRKLMVQISYSNWFNYVIMMTIFLNCIAISAYDHSEQNLNLNFIAEQISAAFTVVYIIEAIIKIIADGFVMGKGTYLRNPTNVFDFLIIICSSVGFAFNNRINTSKKVRSFFRILRTLRVFKLLVGFQKVPQLKKQIVTLVRALKGLANVGLFLVFFFILLAIFGLQMFSEEIYNACRTTKEPVLVNGKMFWERAVIDSTLTNQGICTKNRAWYTVGGFKCPEGLTCGSYLDYNLPLEDDGVQTNIWLNYNVAIWKNIGSSILAVFQMVSQDTWSMHMYNLIYATEFFLPVIFSITLNMMGSYFLMNLMLAVIMDEYIKSEQEYEQEQMDFLNSEKEQINSKIQTLQLFKQLAELQSIDKSKTTQPIMSPTQEQTPTLAEKQSIIMENSESSEGDLEESKQELQKKMNSSLLVRSDSLVMNSESQQRRFSVKSNRSNRSNRSLDSQDHNNKSKSQSPSSSREPKQKTHTPVLERRGQVDKSKNPLMGRFTKGMSLMLTKKQTELLQMQNEIRDITDHELRSKVTQMQNFIELVHDNKQTDHWTDKRHLQLKIESEQKDILKNLNLTLKQNYRQDKYVNFGLKNENMINAFITNAVKQDAQQEDLTHKTFPSDSDQSFDDLKPKPKKQQRKKDHEIEDIAMKMKKVLENQPNPNEETKTQTQTQQTAIIKAKTKRTFGMQKAFLKREILEQRIQGNFVLEASYKIEQSKVFNFFISACIIGNTVLLAFDQFPQNVQSEMNNEFVNFIFFIVFLSEMVIKLLANGVRLYFKNRYNLFDFIVILISLIDLILQNMQLSNMGLSAIRALRIFRLLRVFKLAKVWKSFNYLIQTITNTFKKLTYFTVLVGLFWFIYAIIGKEIFAFKMSFTADLIPIPKDYDFTKGRFNQGYTPDFNFDTFLNSFITVFSCIAGGSWSAVFYDAMRFPETNYILSLVFFYSLYIGGKNILFQLFLAILLNEFDEGSVTQAAEKEVKEKKEGSTFQQIIGCLKKTGRKIVGDEEKIEKSKSICLRFLKKDKPKVDEDTPSESEVQPEQPDIDSAENDADQQGGLRVSIKGKKPNRRSKSLALGCLSTTNPIRRLCIYLTKEQDEKAGKLDSVIWIFIAISCIQLAFQSPILDQKSKLALSIKYIDYVMTVIFALEMMIKVIAFGLVNNGKKSYLREPSNVLDLFVVVMSIVDALSTKDLGFIKLVRMAKLARPLKLVFRNEKLKISIQALLSSTPQILNLLMLVLLIYTIFGIIAINFFKGRLFECKNVKMDKIDPNKVLDMYDCLNFGGQWEALPENFNNFQNAFQQMFMMAQAVNWQSIMLTSMKSDGVSLGQKLHAPYGSGIYYSFFFMVWIVFGGFFIQNLFVGVVISQYNRQSERLGKNFLLTEQQKNWIETKLMINKIKPKVLLDQPTNPVRKFFFQFIKSGKYRKTEEPLKVCGKNLSDIFDWFIMSTILVNTCILCCKWPNMNKKSMLAVDIVNYVCTGIFIVEALIKITAQGLQYFKEGWNLFDFIIVVGSLAFISPTFKKQKNTITMIRAFRVGRVLKLFSKLKQLQGIFQTVMLTLPALMNVGMLMLLIIYMFAIVGVEYFGDIKLNPPMSRLMNFQTMPKAFLTLFTVATGDGWNFLLEALQKKNSVMNRCIQNPTYQDYLDNGKQTIGCGSGFAAIYLYLFVFMISIIFLNLFIAIILQGYFNQVQKQTDDGMKAKTDRFREVWAKLDPCATGKINREDLSNLLFSVGKDLGWKESYKKSQERQQQYIDNLCKNMVEHHNDPDNKLYFTEVLDNLMLFFVIKTQVKKEMQNQGININSDEEDEADGQTLKEKSLRHQSIIQNKMEHLEEGLNQKDAQLVKQLRTVKRESNVNLAKLAEKRMTSTQSMFIDEDVSTFQAVNHRAMTIVPNLILPELGEESSQGSDEENAISISNMSEIQSNSVSQASSNEIQQLAADQEVNQSPNQAQFESD